jgi:hypothetical protein
MNAACYDIVELKVYIGSQGSVFSIITRLQAELSEVRIPAGPRDICLLQNVQTRCEVHLAPLFLVSSG